MKRIISQCRKELVQFSRDRLTLALAFILPVMTLFIFGFAIRLLALIGFAVILLTISAKRFRNQLS